jgi:hypothetical protein
MNYGLLIYSQQALMTFIFLIPISLSKFAPYFPKSERNHNNYRGQERVKVLIDGLIAKGFCCYPEISREVTLEAKNKELNNYSLKTHYSVNSSLKEEKNNSRTLKPHECFH